MFRLLLICMGLSLAVSSAFGDQPKHIKLSDSDSTSLAKTVAKTFDLGTIKDSLEFSSLMCSQIPMYGYMCTIGMSDGRIIEKLGGGNSEKLYKIINAISGSYCEPSIICANILGTTSCPIIKKGVFGNTYSCDIVVAN